jgi:hypothetical protein
MSKYNIVTNERINNIIKTKCIYYKIDLGFVSTIENKAGVRELNSQDTFAYFYNSRYNTTIRCKGRVGDIRFHIDHYILEDKIAFYVDREEFVFDYDHSLLMEKGAEFYLGHLIKKVELQLENKKEVKTQEKNTKKQGNADLVTQNPGSVSYDDIRAYLEKQRLERLSVKK